MKRVNLQDYFELAQTLATAKQTLSVSTMKGGALFFSNLSLQTAMRDFLEADNGFSTCKHAASELLKVATRWVETVMPGAEYVDENFNKEHPSWEYAEVVRCVDDFKSVFRHECGDVDVYSVGEISLYKTSSLVSSGSKILPPEVRAAVSDATREEFVQAARCLAFDLPTACGFHALRALELVMDDYLSAFEVDTTQFKSWADYIKAAEAIIADENAPKRPSAKVAAMLDRMRSLDRNPLMHPRDSLDLVGADQLFKLSAITVVEMVKELQGVAKKKQPALKGQKAIAAPEVLPVE